MKVSDPLRERHDFQPEERSKLREVVFAYERENMKLLQQLGTRMVERLCTAVGVSLARRQ